MSEHAGQDEAALIDKLLTFAEARETLTDCPADPMFGADVVTSSSSNEHLLLIAQHELERHHLRKRHLPAEICTDLGWRMILDLFECDQIMIKTPTQDFSNRWGVSAGTAARQMAALIETGLACRVMSDGADGQYHLTLTVEGRERMKRVLQSFSYIS